MEKRQMGVGEWFGASQRAVRPVGLHECVSEDLKKQFHELKLQGHQIANVEAIEGNFTPDLAIRYRDRVVLIEIKTGDPSLPLPSSANSQMLILKEKAHKHLAGVEIVPVLVTNYKIDDAGRKELAMAASTSFPYMGLPTIRSSFQTSSSRLRSQLCFA